LQIEKLDKSNWLNLLDELDTYPPFYSPIWLESYEKLRKNYKIGAFSVKCENSLFIFPYLRSSILIFHAIYSGPLGTYGGPIPIKNTPPPRCIQQFIDFLKKHFVKIVINFDPFNKLQSFPFSGFKKIEGFTHVIDINRDDIFTDTFVRGAKKATKEGVIVINSPDFIDDFVNEFFKRRDWVDKRLYGKDFFFKELLEKNMARLYTAIFKARPVAHVFLILGKKYAFYHYGVSDRKFLHLRPNNLLHVKIVEDLKTMGFKYYNLGSSTGLQGVEEFKRRMGAKKFSTTTLLKKFP